MKARTLQLAITEFALPTPRRGSIEAYSGFGALPEVGLEMHARIQADRLREYPIYVPEKWIARTFARARHSITVSGRMDGYVPGHPALIEEIKTAYQLEQLKFALEKNLDHPYRLQLQTYMYLHHLQFGEIPRGRLHLVCARTGRAENLDIELDLKSFEPWLERRLVEIENEDDMFEKLKKRRKKSARTFAFPFPVPRLGQRELIDTVAKGIGNKGRVLVQAPTGLGKTAAITLPVLQEAMGRGQKALYVTAKNSQHAVAEDAAKQLQTTGAKVKAITIHAKGKMCLKDEVFCNPDYCEFARDHYTKVSEKGLIAALAKKKSLNARTFRRFAKLHEVCPFELQLDVAHRADLVIGDYNYAFSPRGALGRLVANGYGKTEGANIIVDEAHNLPQRAADYFSSRLSSDELSVFLREAIFLDDDLAGEMRALARMIDARIRDLVPEERRHAPHDLHLDPLDFADLVGKAQELMGRYLGSNYELRQNDPVLAFCNKIADFGQALGQIGSEFFCTYAPGREGGTLKIVCCDASSWLRERYHEFANVVLFSATLKPFDYYARLLGVDGEDLVTAEFQSPFPRENRKLLIIPQVSTKYRDRAANYEKIAAAIAKITALRPGNYFVFFPSFDFLYQLASRLSVPGFDVVTQPREMRREAVQGVLDRLREGAKPMLILAVQGGVFAEGVDYPGDMLIGAIVVGPALPTFDFERERLRQYYDEKHAGQGFDYAYTYPAMAKVIQSAGRVIRSGEDRGLIVLMDRRFLHESYLKTMPADWVGTDGPQALVSERILSEIEAFWRERET